MIKTTAEIYPFTAGKAFTIPLNPEDAFACWNKESIPKRKWLLDFYTSVREGIVVTKIITRRKKKDINDKKHLTKQRCNSFNVALFSCPLTLSNPVHFEALKQMLRLIGVENIHAIHYDFTDDYSNSKTVRSFKVKAKKINKVKGEELHYLREFDLNQLFKGSGVTREISKHLTQDFPHLSEEVSDEDIETFIDSYFEQNSELLPCEKLIEIHSKSNEWVRTEKIEVSEQAFEEILDKCIEYLSTQFEYFQDEPLRSDLDDKLGSHVHIFAAHAIVESHYIKLAQRSVSPRLSEKKHSALIWWEIYKSKKRPPQRTIAKDIDVPLSTLNLWFKEFKQRT